MNNNYVIAFLSKDKDIILEPLAKFNGETIYFKTERDAKQYVQKLYVNSGLEDIEAMSDDDGLEVIRVQQKGNTMHKSQIKKELYKLPKTATFQVDKVLEWIKHNLEVSRSMAREIRMNTQGAIAKRSMRDGYVKDMRHYLRTGDWISPFYGKDMKNRTKMKVIAHGVGVWL